MDFIHLTFWNIFYKRDNFNNIPVCFPKHQATSARGLLLKKRICSQRVNSFLLDDPFLERRQKQFDILESVSIRDLQHACIIRETCYSEACVRKPHLRLTLVVDVERWLSYKGTCHVILLAKLHDMYLYKTDNFFHINHYLNSVSKVALLQTFQCTSYEYFPRY